MEHIRLGLTDLHVSRVGFGCAAMGRYDYGETDDSNSIAAVHKALDLGINFFDTADIYGLGHAEEILGTALGGRRHEVVVATKFGIRWDETGHTTRDLSPKRVVEALEESLRRLRLDRIAVYQIHWPDDKTMIADTLAALQKCQDSGKVYAIGCCNFPIELLDEAQSYQRLECLQMPYSLAERVCVPIAERGYHKYQMSILCYNPLAQGLFTGKYNHNSKFEGTDLRRRSELFRGPKFEANLKLVDRLRIVAEREGRKPAQVAIRWILDTVPSSCALTGIKTPKQIEECLWFLA